MPATLGDDYQSSATPIHGHILLVEDNPQVAAVTAQMLSAMGFDVEVTDRVSTSGERIDLLMTDVVMPEGMNGLDLAIQVRARFPTLPIILTSGYNEVVTPDSMAFPLLRKPVPYEELYRAIQACLENLPTSAA